MNIPIQPFTATETPVPIATQQSVNAGSTTPRPGWLRGSHCGRCHTCGTALREVLDGEEWCPRCEIFRRYRSHGWSVVYREFSPCP